MSPMDTAEIANEKYIYLTTRGRRTGNPHTVELWFAVVGGRIYLSHEGKPTDWMKNILKDDNIEFRIRGNRYQGRASIVRSGDAFKKGKHSLYQKYYGKASRDVIDDWFSESAVIEVSEIVKG